MKDTSLKKFGLPNCVFITVFAQNLFKKTSYLKLFILNICEKEHLLTVQ